ncbi:hypothetical protein [Azoarcus olearius]|uniref:hypothetical protein n=1 Tax=Azoarcus sp. (strain BH72) TaxID=418699 RepID=UPI0011D187D3|nr:hypothetical protein [Azoarcus olearius]
MFSKSIFFISMILPFEIGCAAQNDSNSQLVWIFCAGEKIFVHEKKPHSFNVIYGVNFNAGTADEYHSWERGGKKPYKLFFNGERPWYFLQTFKGGVSGPDNTMNWSFDGAFGPTSATLDRERGTMVVQIKDREFDFDGQGKWRIFSDFRGECLKIDPPVDPPVGAKKF